jgi:hypothetical protein
MDSDHAPISVDFDLTEDDKLLVLNELHQRLNQLRAITSMIPDDQIDHKYLKLEKAWSKLITGLEANV